MNEKIMLIVDDIEANRAALAQCFECDFSICHASNGQEAVRQIEKYGEQIAVVLLDIIMPVMDGLAVLHWLASSEYRFIPVIAITSEPSYQLEVLESGAWDFISKPTDVQVLRARVNNVLSRYALEDERRHSAEVARAKLEMENLVNSLPGGIAKYRVTDKGFETIYFSDGVAALTGHTREEYIRRIGTDAASIVYEEDKSRLVSATISAIQHGKSVDEIYRIYHKDGSLVWVHLNGRLLGEENGVPILHAVFQRPEQMTQLYGNLVNESQNMIYVTDVNTYQLLFVNETALRELGKGANEYTGEKCYKFLFGLSAPCPFCKQQCMSADHYYARDFRYPKTGKIYALRGKLTDWNGLPAHVEYLRDVTEARNTERQKDEAQRAVEKLRAQAQEALERYLLLVNTVPGGIVQYEVRDGRLETRFFSDGMSELTGYSRAEREQMDSKTVLALTYPEDVPLLKSAIQTAIPAKGNIDITYRMSTKSGEPKWVHLTAAASAGAQGECLYQAVFTDVDKLKQTERALQENQLRYETAIKSAGINIWEYDIQADSLFVVSNSPRIKQNCFKIENYVQVTLRGNFVREDSISDFLRLFERLRQGESEVTEDIWYRTNDGMGWWCERVTYTATVDSSGKPSKAFGAGRDVTREKEAENKFYEEMSYRKAIQSDNLVSVMIDLTDNRVIEVESGFSVMQNMKGCTAEAYFEQTEKAITGSNFAERYRRVFNRNSLINSFGSGEYVVSQVLTRVYDSNKIFWINYSAHLVQNPETKHVLAHISCVDITQNMVMKTIMETIARTDYDSFTVVDGSFDSALDYGTEPDKHLYDPNQSFEAQIEALIRSLVCPEDVERVVSECKIE